MEWFNWAFLMAAGMNAGLGVSALIHRDKMAALNFAAAVLCVYAAGVS